MSDPSLKLPEPPPELTALSHQLCARIVSAIEAGGAISFQRYMEMALYEPGLGYYVNGLHRFGASGDFVTAPEQGRLFAQALARKLAPVIDSLDADWTLMELGPGSGALARELIVHLECPPARYLLLEPSAALRQVQQAELATLPKELAARFEWLDQPPEKAFSGAIIANEVIDALPVERFRIAAGDVKSMTVDVDPASGRLVWVEGPASDRLRRAVRHVCQDLPEALPEGYTSEICVDLPDWLQTVTAAMACGMALMIDYGYPRREYYHAQRSDGTLVCHYRHRAHFDPFVWPGLTDLSAFVDFTTVAEAARTWGLDVAGFTTQAGFLLESGVHNAIESTADDRKRLRLAGEFKRLVLPGEMGDKFKLMTLVRNLDPALGEFEFADQLHRL
ncbi:MAG: SAM-dependent methyltransferase [Xanthomonadaceae bacterium]|nr:SAM-dependent methyltransferase [Xanthomonadaceae bacterium]